MNNNADQHRFHILFEQLDVGQASALANAIQSALDTFKVNERWTPVIASNASMRIHRRHPEYIEVSVAPSAMHHEIWGDQVLIRVFLHRRRTWIIDNSSFLD